VRRRHLSLLIALLAAPAFAVDVTVVGLFPGKAVVQINGGAPRILTAGQKTAEGVVLVSADRDSATFDIAGTRRTLKLGQQQVGNGSSGAQRVTLSADARGHFLVDGQINGAAVRFLVDTGATMVSVSRADAERLGLNYLNGTPFQLNTDNGVARAWKIRLDTVRVGDITVNGVDAAVVDNLSMPTLLGMSFLNRMDLRREGEVLTITRRF
jgi:aspartyl protease family protein